MKATIVKEALVAALDHVTRVVERRNTIPILSNVLIKAKDGSLSFKASDLDIEATSIADAEVQDEGEITVAASTFTDFVKKLQAGASVSLDVSSGKMLIKAGRSRSNLVTLPATDFPDLSTGKFEWEFTVAASKLTAMIDQTSFAISTEETRYYLCGVYLHHADGCLRAVTTDGHRLALHDIKGTDTGPGMNGIIIPRKTINEMARILKGVKDDVTLEGNATKIRLTCGRTVLTSKLIDGSFPDYSRVIPTGNNMVAVVPREALAATADRVSTVSSERGRAVKMTFSPRKLMLSASNPGTGEASDDVEIDGDIDLELGVNSAYLQDVLRAMPAEKIRMAMADPGSPILFKSEGGDDSSLFVLMPMRV